MMDEEQFWGGGSLPTESNEMEEIIWISVNQPMIREGLRWFA